MLYDPRNPTVYFDIGEAVAAIAILLAFVALATPTNKFRWALGWFRLRTAYFLFFLGIFFVLIAAVLPVLPTTFPHLMGFPVFWEVLAGLVFVFGSLGLLICGAHPVRFSNKNYMRFFQRCYLIIGRGDKKEVSALADEIGYSAKILIDTCSEYQRHVAYLEKKAGKEYSVSEPTRCALDIFNLFSDRQFCNTIVTRYPGTAIIYLKEIQRKHFYDSGGGSFVEQMISEAFSDPDSILHREERFSGLGHFLPFTETVFGDYSFISSNFRPLQSSGFRHDNIKNLEKYSFCFQRALRAFFGPKTSFDTAAISCGFRILKDSASHFAYILNGTSLSRNSEDDPIYALGRISDAYLKSIELLIEQNGEIITSPFAPDKYDRHRDNSIFGIMARSLYEYLVQVSCIEEVNWGVRFSVIDLWMGIYGVSDRPEHQSIIEIQKRLEIQLWEKVDINLSQKHACYPMLTKLLISVVGLNDSSVGSKGRLRVSRELQSRIREKFHSASQLSEERTQELLPDGYEYDSDMKQIVQKSNWSDSALVFQCD